MLKIRRNSLIIIVIFLFYYSCDNNLNNKVLNIYPEEINHVVDSILLIYDYNLDSIIVMNYVRYNEIEDNKGIWIDSNSFGVHVYIKSIDENQNKQISVKNYDLVLDSNLKVKFFTDLDTFPPKILFMQ